MTIGVEVAIVAALIAGVSALVGLMSFIISRHNAAKHEGAKWARIEADNKRIFEKIDEMRTEQKEQRADIKELGNQVNELNMSLATYKAAKG